MSSVPANGKHGPQPVAAAHLDPEVLHREGEALSKERHRATASFVSCARVGEPSGRRTVPPSMRTIRVAMAPREGSCVATTTVRPRAPASVMASSTTSFAPLIKPPRTARRAAAAPASA
jgi:hypothetical protein